MRPSTAAPYGRYVAPPGRCPFSASSVFTVLSAVSTSRISEYCGKDGLGPKMYESKESPSWYTTPAPSGKNDGHATAGIGWLMTSRGFENVGGFVEPS